MTDSGVSESNNWLISSLMEVLVMGPRRKTPGLGQTSRSPSRMQGWAGSVRAAALWESLFQWRHRLTEPTRARANHMQILAL